MRHLIPRIEIHFLAFAVGIGSESIGRIVTGIGHILSITVSNKNLCVAILFNLYRYRFISQQHSVCRIKTDDLILTGNTVPRTADMVEFPERIGLGILVVANFSIQKGTGSRTDNIPCRFVILRSLLRNHHRVGCFSNNGIFLPIEVPSFRFREGWFDGYVKHK